jgi:hypothetical protein
MRAVVIVLALMAVVGAGINERKSSASEAAETREAQGCMSTPVGTLCGESAVAYCERSSKPTVIGTGDSSKIVYVVADVDADACARVGWYGG